MTGRAGKTIFVACISYAIKLVFFTFRGRRNMMYEVLKVINNNIVSAKNAEGEEIILRGLGIGFQKKPRDKVEESQIEKIYKIANPNTRNKLQELLSDIPLEYLNTCTEVIEHAKASLKRQLNENIYLTLTDHISFAIERLEKGQCYKNALLMETKRFYPAEYEIGIEALDIIKEKLAVELPIDEAGFIALHIVNAELDTQMSDMMHITELIQNVLNIIKDYYKIDFDEESLYYDRLVTHLKFFGQRLFNNEGPRNEDLIFLDMVKRQYPNDYRCAELIRQYIEATYKKSVGEEEMAFLTVHMKRITDNS